MLILNDIEQGSPEWFSARLGIPSSSHFGEILTPTGKPSKQAEKYMYTLAGERITGTKTDTYQSAAMARGMEMESEAKQFYELINDIETQQVGVCFANEDKQYCSSPDSLVGDEGLLEIKCPILSVAVEYLLSGKLPTVYYPQCQGQIFVTGRKWVDFLSYYPGLPPLIIRVERDTEFLIKLKVALDNFCADLETITTQIKELQ